MKKRNLMMAAELLGSAAGFALSSGLRFDENGEYHSPNTAYVTSFTETFHDGGFMVSQDNGTRSRDQATLISGQTLNPGTVLGKIGTSTAAPTYAANAGNTGNFTCSAVVEEVGAVPGLYAIEMTSATLFNVYNPSGELIGEGVLGTLFNTGGLHFTLTAGGTPAVAEDGATITVVAGSGKYTQLNLSGADGSQNAAAILWGYTDASGGDTQCTIVTRGCEVNGSELTWPSGISGPQKTAAIAQLAALGIIVR